MDQALQHFEIEQNSTSQFLPGSSCEAGYPAPEIDVKEYCIRRWEVMISKCANPNCSKLLMRLDGGRFYGFPMANKTIEHFWLCSNCSKNFVLRYVEGRVELLRRDRRIA